MTRRVTPCPRVRRPATARGRAATTAVRGPEGGPDDDGRWPRGPRPRVRAPSWPKDDGFDEGEKTMREDLNVSVGAGAR
ncbi:hypothetical protein GCM10027294_03350 [Marinactinospora endophytica]